MSEESEERLSWRLAAMTPEGVSKRKEKTLEGEREEAVKAQEARESEEKEAVTLREECEREKRAQVAQVSLEKHDMMQEFEHQIEEMR